MNKSHTIPLPPEGERCPADKVVPSLYEGENLWGQYRDNIPYHFVIKGVLSQTHDAIVYEALEDEFYDLGGRWHPIEIVEIVCNEKYEYPLLDAVSIVYGKRDSATYPRYIEHNLKTYFIRANYEACKLKSGNHASLHGADYEVVQTVGRGSYGEVLKLLCTSRSLRNKVRMMLHFTKKYSDVLAVKQFCMPSYDTSKDPHATIGYGELTAKVRFKHGYDAMVRLHHPNVVKVYDYFVKGDIPCFTMEYIEGCNLREYVDRSGCMSEQEARTIMLTICKTIKYCHEQGVYHGDLKPNNVMVTSGGTIKLIDFEGATHCSDIVGLARVYIYLLTGVFLSIRNHSRLTPEAMKQVAAILYERKVSDVVKSQIFFMLEDTLVENKTLDFILYSIENNTPMPLKAKYNPCCAPNSTWEEGLVWCNPRSNKPRADVPKYSFYTFVQDGHFGMKNKQGDIVIPPIYSLITEIGNYHIPGPGPTSGWDIVGVKTYRLGRIGWHEIVNDNQMRLVIELTAEQMEELSMLT